MVKKMTTSIYLDGEVFREAKDLGLNISKISENALKDAIARLKGKRRIE
jgi:post-segregation antitoxin (ccd killing protein)